jgi:hypothetical protein
LVACNNVRRVQLVVQVVDAVLSNEHAIGIVHESLRRAEMDLRPEPTGVVAWNRCICRERRGRTEVACLLCGSKEGEAGDAATDDGLHFAWRIAVVEG